IYELGGPDVETLGDIVKGIAKVCNRRRLVINAPFIAGRFIAMGFDFMQFVTGGLITNKILTGNQVRDLRNDNVVSEGAKGFADLGITPTPSEAVVPEYLYRYRPQGQYDAITNSAKNLKA
ncbi:complex I NDUFA9 subunit family protein, partial [Escherichia coli]|nr:complex I NDUFA9 subunit family protein [Escherichia coli]